MIPIRRVLIGVGRCKASIGCCYLFDARTRAIKIVGTTGNTKYYLIPIKSLKKMQIPRIADIEGLLDNPIFEEQYTGKQALLTRILKPQSPLPTAFVFNRWSEDEVYSVFYAVKSTALGDLLLAATHKGLCFVAPANLKDFNAMADLQLRFGDCDLEGTTHPVIDSFVKFLDREDKGSPMKLHLRGTVFQYSVWQRLAGIAYGTLTTYGLLGGSAATARATGAAVGANPIFYFLPCHRVVRKNGHFDGFYWGATLKRLLIAAEGYRY